MIAQIATEAGLGFNDEYHNDNNQWRQLAQTSETDWEMILNLADRLGARIVYERGVIRLINYLDISFRQLASRFYTSKTNITLLDKTDEQAGTVVEYVPTNMSVRDPSYRSPTLSYLSSKRAVMLSPPMQSSTAQPTVGASSQGALLVSRFATDYPANSQQEAEAYQSGYYQPPWNEEGQLRVTGDALMMPGLIIQVMSSGKGLTMSADYDGVWYVRGVTHSLGTHGRFWSTLDIARTAARGSNWYQPQPFWLRDKRGAPVLRSNGAGQWISNWRAA
jgi:hypothetical protein